MVLSIANRPSVRPEHEQGQKQGQEPLFLAKLSDAPSPQVHIEPLEGHQQIDGEMIKTRAEVACQVKFKIHLDPVQQNLRYASILLRLPPPQSKFWILPLQSLSDLGPVTSQLHSPLASLSLSFQLPSHQHAAINALGRSACLFQSRKGKRRGKTAAINEDTVRAADGNGDGDAKVAQQRPVKRRKSDSANVIPRTQRMKDASREKKG